jgi:hypothetical protein
MKQTNFGNLTGIGSFTNLKILLKDLLLTEQKGERMG